MQTQLLPFDHPQAFAAAEQIIQQGGIISFPTDTVYGIGASAFNRDAIEKIFVVKARSKEKSIPVLIGSPQDLDSITVELNPVVARVIDHFWPGALTVIVPMLPGLPENLSAENTVGIRIPDHDLTRQLLRITGPLAATSANLSGKRSARSAQEVLDQLDQSINLILDGGITPGGIPSTVLDCTGDSPAVLREGPITEKEIHTIIN
jgi:L-threonylcarbamoyladenylate synthase